MTASPDLASLSWGTLLLLGAFHGINPGMGWLFAVALGLQENRAAAVWRAMLPLGLGHACAIAVALAMVIVAGVVIPAGMLRWPIAGLLVILGVRRLLRHRHPQWGGMRMGMGGLTIWSFLVATAHGAGLMVLPVWLHDAAPSGHVHAAASLASGIAATIVHGAGYLAVTAVMAWIVFSKLGVGLLRTAWINLDMIWAVALILSGAFMVTV
ncbi:MAG: hypothetical protein ACRD15_11155 [Vicinamibacterales bacterium]